MSTNSIVIWTAKSICFLAQFIFPLSKLSEANSYHTTSIRRNSNNHLFGNRNEIKEIKGVACSFAASCMNCSNKSSLIWFYDHVGSCISIFLAASNLFAACLPEKRVWRLHSVCSFWEAAYQFGNSNDWFCLIFHHWWTDQCTKKASRPPSNEYRRSSFSA